MPKPSRNEEELQEIRNNVLDVAAGIVAEEGYQSLSMRKIARTLGISATTIYYYFSSKDEINIAIRKRAGEILYARLLEAYSSTTDLKEKSWLMIRAYLEYGLHQPNYYAIMFDLSAPKHLDYVGTPLEEAARDELESSMRSAELMLACMTEFADAGYAVPDNIEVAQIALWSELHGMVSLYNNRLLKELGFPEEEDVIAAARMFLDMILMLYGTEKAAG